MINDLAVASPTHHNHIPSTASNTSAAIGPAIPVFSLSFGTRAALAGVVAGSVIGVPSADAISHNNDSAYRIVMPFDYYQVHHRQKFSETCATLAELVGATNASAGGALQEIAEAVSWGGDEDDTDGFEPVSLTACAYAAAFIKDNAERSLSFTAWAEQEGEMTVQVESANGSITIMFVGDNTLAAYGTFEDGSYVKLKGPVFYRSQPVDLTDAVNKL